MGKKRDKDSTMSTEKTEDEVNETTDESPAAKKHKKHKKHKHRKKHETDDPTQMPLSSPEDPSKPSIKLKIKIGGQTLGTKSVSKTEGSGKEENSTTTGIQGQIDVKKEGNGKKKEKRDTDDEESEWLKALEEGTLDDNGEVKKDKNPNLMTARQRALLFGAREEALLQLPTGYKNQELTEEQLQRRQQKAKRRKQQAHEKREKDKKQTIDRLLKKQESKSKGSKGRGRKDVPRYRYLLTQSSATISVPQGFNFPFVGQKAIKPPERQTCGVPGCTNTKKYSCSKTGVPLCSLECYKKNQIIHQRTSISV